AVANSLPNLEIEADDVKCSHAATVGHLEEEVFFYLLSRGIPRETAQRLIVLGFLGDVLTRLSLPGVVEKVTRKIEEKLRSG
ncbi:MAG: SufD family Fe-S cluster assembly protein, partial [Gemmatimonadetes bacterium]|nr:SufD family Fe-S cluster assembly protein [Gemmatimonadota bacterium]